MSTSSGAAMAEEDNAIYGVLHPRIVKMIAANFSSPEGVVYQLLCNMKDACSPTAEIRIGKRGAWIEATDSGTGIPIDRFPAVVGMGDDGKLNDESAIGEFGTGLKSIFAAFERICIWTVTADDPYEYAFAFTAAEAFDSMIGKKPIRAASKRLKGSAGTKLKTTTGTVIRGETRRTDSKAVYMSLSRLKKRLGPILPPSWRRWVTLNGSHLPVTNLTGEVYASPPDGDRIDGVGQVEILMGVSEEGNVRPKHDRVWGSWGAVCDHGTMLDHCPDEKIPAFPPELQLPNVWFSIFVRSFKEFEAEHTRNHYVDALYKSERFVRVMAFVRSAVLPLLRQKLQEQGTITPEMEELSTQVTSVLRERLGDKTLIDPVGTGSASTPRAPSAKTLRISPGRIDLLCNEECTFYIEDDDTESMYEVDGTLSGGQVWDPEKKRWCNTIRLKGLSEFRFKAGVKIGRHWRVTVLRFRTGEKDPDTVVATVLVHKSVTFSISPKRITLEPGAAFKGELKVKGHDDHQPCMWSISDGGGRVTPIEGSSGHRARISAGLTPGDYRVCCRQGETLAECFVRVRPPSSNSSDKREKSLRIGGLTFGIECIPSQKANIVSNTDGHSGHVTLIFNTQRPAAEAAKRNGTLMDLVLRESVRVIAHYVARHETGGEEPSNIAIGKVYSDLLDRLYG